MRRIAREIYIGNVKIGGNNPIVIQSMTNTKTADIKGTLLQLQALYDAGCELCRLAVPNDEAALALSAIVADSPMPLIADIHFDYRLALKSIKAGVSGIRINPGNIGGEARVRAVVEAASAAAVSIRIGVNGGSLEKDILQKYGGITADALCESALRHVAILEGLGFYETKISLKTSSVPLTVAAYRQLAVRCDYPLHLGLTEAGCQYSGTVKSAVAIGILLNEGIGDTIRVSLTAPPVEEIYAAKEILNALELIKKPFDVIACPTCGRTEVDLISMAQQVEKAVLGMHSRKPVKIAVMGCAVNGPGEAKEADFGIACGKEEGLLFSNGEIIGKFPQELLLPKLLELIKNKQEL